MPADLVGTLVNNRYRLTRWIHTSATGDVFEAVDQKLLGPSVALKVLNRNLPGNAAASGYLRRRFEEEAQISIQLGGHPHIAQVRDFDLDGDRPFLVMELPGSPPFMGRHLGDLLDSDGPLSPERFLTLSIQICSALDFAHHFHGEIDGIQVRGVLHRDIKPANIFVIQEPVLGESAVVFDFGIAKLISDVNINLGTSLFGFVGTLSHASPEQMQGKILDPRTDIYSLGVVLYQMLSCRLPINAETDNFPGWYEAHNFQAPTPLRDLDLAQPVPHALESVILSCLAKEPEARPESMQVLSQQLEQTLRPHVDPNTISSLKQTPLALGAAQSTAVLTTQPNSSLSDESSGSDSQPSLPSQSSSDPSASRREFVRPRHRPTVTAVGQGDRYRIEDHLGSGGMGEVYLATDTHLGRQVAVKIMTGNASEDARTLVKRFQREVEVCASLNSPHIVQITDFGTTEQNGGHPFFVMEYLQGETLGQLLSRTGKLPIDRALRIIAQVCSGLAEAHSHGVVHRDLKPDNIFLIPGTLWELAKILDFGVAKVMNQEGGNTKTKLTVMGAFVGTLRYASPEQCSAQAEVNRSTDIYSLGIILYEMLSGANPFNLEINTARDNFLWLDAHTRAQPIPIQHQPGCEQIPDDLADVIMRCLHKLPAERFASVEDLMAVLQPHLQLTVDKRAPSNRSSISAPQRTEKIQRTIKTRASETPVRKQSIDRSQPTEITRLRRDEQPSLTLGNIDHTIVEERPPLIEGDQTVVEKGPTAQSKSNETVVESRTIDLNSSETVVEQKGQETPETIVENKAKDRTVEIKKHKPIVKPKSVTSSSLPQPANINIDPDPTTSIPRPIFDRDRFHPLDRGTGSLGKHKDVQETQSLRPELDLEKTKTQSAAHNRPDYQYLRKQEKIIEDEIGQIDRLFTPMPSPQPPQNAPSKQPNKESSKESIWSVVLIVFLGLVIGGTIIWGVSEVLLDSRETSSSTVPDTYP